MSDPIDVIDREAQAVLQISSVASVFAIAKTLGNSYQRITDQLKATSSEACGPPFARYSNLNWDRISNAGMLAQIWQMLTEKMHIQAGMPVSPEASGSGDIEATEIPAGRYVRTIHTGPYHKVGETYKHVVSWASQQGLVLQGWSLESYIDDPDTVPSAEVRTQVFVPLA